MTKFAKKILLFLVPIILCFFCLEIILKQIPNDYKYKAGYLDKNANQIQTLIFGSSHSFFGVNPIFFSSNTFNASHVSQSLDYDYKILCKYKARLTNLSDIYIPLSYFTLWAKLKNENEHWRLKSYFDSYGFKEDVNFIESFAISKGLKMSVKRSFKYLFLQKSERTCSDLGWGTTFNSTNSQDLEMSGKSAAIRHTKKNLLSAKNAVILDDNVRILKEIITWCKNKEINVILFTPPAYKTYRDQLNPEQLKRTISIGTEFSKKYNNCQYINLLSDETFVKEDFYDADHLSEIGAEKLSLKLNEL